MANRDNPRGIEWIGNLYGGSAGPTVFRLPVTASDVVTAGDVVAISGGYVLPATATEATVFGVAAESGDSSSAVDYIDVIPALPGYLWRGNFDGTLELTDVGTYLDFKATEGAFELEDASTEDHCLVLGMYNDGNNDISEANGDVIFTIHTTMWAGIAAGV